MCFSYTTYSWVLFSWSSLPICVFELLLKGIGLFLSLRYFHVAGSLFPLCLTAHLTCCIHSIRFIGIVGSIVSLQDFLEKFFRVLVWWSRTSFGALCHRKTLFLNFNSFAGYIILGWSCFLLGTETIYSKLSWPLRFVLRCLL